MWRNTRLEDWMSQQLRDDVRRHSAKKQSKAGANIQGHIMAKFIDDSKKVKGEWYQKLVWTSNTQGLWLENTASYSHYLERYIWRIPTHTSDLFKWPIAQQFLSSSLKSQIKLLISLHCSFQSNDTTHTNSLYKLMLFLSSYSKESTFSLIYLVPKFGLAK